MNKVIVLAVGSSSWWKSKKIRKETAIKLKNLKKNWKLLRKELQEPSKNTIDTKTYKKYYFYR
tara:strand:+ start:406 stop:594 length:189 start_codon:yes stop_codon:yes gene_type:complete